MKRLIGLAVVLAVGMVFSTSMDVRGYPGQADTDGDGIADVNDVDDDNDGILDTDEGFDATASGLSGAVPAAQVSFDITSSSPTTVNTDHFLNGFTISGSANIDGVYTDLITPDSYTENFTGSQPNGSDVDELLRGVKQGSLDDASWNADVIDAFQSRNLSHFQRMDSGPFASDDSYILAYDIPIVVTGKGFIMISERGGNNVQYVEAFDSVGTSLGTIVVMETDHVDTGHKANNFQNVEIAIFPLDQLASAGDQIASIEIKQTLTTNATDGGDGKVFIYNGGCLDSDDDGVCNHIDLDSDNDGLSDMYEAENTALMALDANSNGTIEPGEDAPDLNGLPSSLSGTGTVPAESGLDADSIADLIDLDADGDGIPDATEARASADYVAYPATVDTTADSDNDGILDVYDSDGTAVPGVTTFGSTLAAFKTNARAPYTDADDGGDALPDYIDLDADGDGVLDSDPEESGTITGVSFADPDGDVNNPLTSGVLDNDDDNNNGSDVDVDFRSLEVAPVITNNALANIAAANVSSYGVSGTCAANGDSVSVVIDDGSTFTAPANTTCSGGTFSVSVDTSALGEGAITVTSTIDDSTFPAVSDIDLTVKDTVLPVVTINSIADVNAATVMATYPVSGTCTIGDGNVTLMLPGATPSSTSVACDGAGMWSTTVDVNGVTNGINALVADATQTDAVGNSGSAAPVQADKDDIAPNMPAVSLDVTGGVDNPVVTFSTLDNIGVDYYTVTYNADDGGPGTGTLTVINPATSPVALTLDPDEGVHSIVVTAYDLYGNQSSTTVLFPPLVTFTAPTTISSTAITDTTITITNPSGNDLTNISITAAQVLCVRAMVGT